MKWSEWFHDLSMLAQRVEDFGPTKDVPQWCVTLREMFECAIEGYEKGYRRELLEQWDRFRARRAAASAGLN